MITENGTIRVSTQIDADIQKELSRPAYILGLIFTVLGAVGIAAFLVFAEIAVFAERDLPSFLYLVVAAVLFALGLIILLGSIKMVKNARASKRIENYEFFGTYFFVEEFNGGEKISTLKMYYARLVKKKETKHYLYLFFQANAAFPVRKANLTEGELNAVRALVGLPVSGTVDLRLPSDGDGSSAETVDFARAAAVGENAESASVFGNSPTDEPPTECAEAERTE